jgi:hypothetical protein
MKQEVVCRETFSHSHVQMQKTQRGLSGVEAALERFSARPLGLWEKKFPKRCNKWGSATETSIGSVWLEAQQRREQFEMSSAESVIKLVCRVTGSTTFVKEVPLSATRLVRM